MKHIKKIGLSLLAFLASFVLVACGGGASSDSGETTTSQAAEESSQESQAAEETSEGTGGSYKIGVVGDVEREVWEDVADRLADQGIDLEIVVFDDYVQPNLALVDGSIDLNAFQHMAFLQDFNESNNETLTPIGYTYISAMAAYSQNYEDLNDLPDGAQVTLPNDPTNGGRALLLLEQAGLIKVDEAAGITPSVDDVVENPKNLVLEEIDAAQVPRTLADADAIVANTNYAVDAGLNPFTDGIFIDTNDLSKVGNQYKCVIAVREADTGNPDFAKIVEAYNQPETEEKIKEVSGGADQRAWDESSTVESVIEDFKNLGK